MSDETYPAEGGHMSAAEFERFEAQRAEAIERARKLENRPPNGRYRLVLPSDAR